MSDDGNFNATTCEVVDVFEKMIKDESTTIFMGYAGSLSVAGQYRIINWLIENHFIDVLVSTGANISEDIVEAIGYSYWQGTHLIEDEKLYESDINRYYDIFGKESDYMEMTELIANFYTTSLQEKYPYSSRELLYSFGKWLQKKKINSIVATASKYHVPIFCPAIVDSPYGDAGLIAKSKGFNLIIDNMKDYTEFMSFGEKIDDSGVIYIGGGVPKDFIQLLAVTANLLYPNREIPTRHREIIRNKERELKETYYPHKYAIQITTDSPQWGGLSGCTFEEAISWGKQTTDSLKVQCYCDETIVLPIVAHALAERIEFKRKQTDFSYLFKTNE